MRPPIDPRIEFDQLPPIVRIAVVYTLMEQEDSTDLLMFYGRHIQQMTLEDLADRLHRSKQGISARLRVLHEKIRVNYERIMNLEGRNYLVSTLTPEERYPIATD